MLNQVQRTAYIDSMNIIREAKGQAPLSPTQEDAALALLAEKRSSLMGPASMSGVAIAGALGLLLYLNTRRKKRRNPPKQYEPTRLTYNMMRDERFKAAYGYYPGVLPSGAGATEYGKAPYPYSGGRAGDAQDDYYPFDPNDPYGQR